MLKKDQNTQFYLFIPQQQQTINEVHPTSYKSPPVKSYFDQIKCQNQFKQNTIHRQSKQVKQLLNNQIEINKKTENINNSSSIQALNTLQYQYQMLNKLPLQICSQKSLNNQTKDYNHQTKTSTHNKIQLETVDKIFIFTNYIKSFEELAFQKLTYLKVLDLSENLLTLIPFHLINQHLISLQILKLNSNSITILPYLKHIKQLEMLNNPLQKITKKFLYMNLNTLQIDWLEYFTLRHPSLIQSPQNQAQDKSRISELKLKKIKSTGSLLKKNINVLTPTQIFKYQYIKKLNQETNKTNKTEQFYDFTSLFKLRVTKSHSLYFQQLIGQLLSTALQKEHYFFIQYLLKYFPKLYYNKMNIYNKFILETALKMRNTKMNKYVMKLFQPQKWPYQNDYPFIDNLLLAIKYQSISFISYLIQLTVSQQILYQNRQTITNFLLTQYKQTSDSQQIATLLCNKINQANQLKINKPIEISLSKFPLQKSKTIMSFYNFIKRNQKFQNLISFQKRSSYYENSIIHFSIKAHDQENFIKFLQNTNNKLDIFQKNSLGQSAKCQTGGDRFCKKLIWHKQKKYLQNFHKPQNSKELPSRLTKIQTVFDKIQPAYIKLGQIRIKSIKSIIKMLGIQCKIMNQIYQNCIQNEYLQGEQQSIYIIFKILLKLEAIQNALKQKTVSLYDFTIMIFKLFQTEIYDKRVYLADQIGKNLLKKKVQTQKDQLKPKTLASQNQSQINYTNDSLLIEYELFHAIPILKTKNLLSTSSINSKDKQNQPQKLSFFDIGSYRCKKCD